jgi:uncharacterized protein (DUF58 family)
MAVILLIAIVLLVIGIWGGIAPFLALGYFLLAVHLLNRFWLNRVLKQLSLKRKHETRAFLGDRVKITLQIENRSNLPLPWLYIEESLPTQLAHEGRNFWLISLTAHEKRDLVYELRAIRRGRYRLGPLEGSAGTIYPESNNLTGDSLDWGLSTHLTIYPLIVPLERLGLPSRLPQGNIKASRSLLPDQSRFAGVRDYSAGDDPRHINWSSSARLGKLQVKEYDRTQMLPLAVFLDLDRASYERSSSWLASECAIAVAASLANYAINLGQTVGLYTNGHDPFIENPEGLTITELLARRRAQNGTAWYTGVIPSPALAADKLNGAKAEPDNSEEVGQPLTHIDVKLPPHNGNGHLTAMLETLARIQLWEAEASLPKLINRWMGDLSWGATVAIIAPKPSPDLVNGMIRLRKSGFAVFSVFTEEAYGLARVNGNSAAVKALGFTSFDAINPEELNVYAQRGSFNRR